MKVVLMYPNCRWVGGYEERTLWNFHPYNICLLSAIIEPKHETFIVDANTDNLSKEEFKNKIAEISPDIVAISILTNEYSKSGIIAADICKSISNKIITVIGGVHASSEYASIILEKSIDYVNVGDGEEVLYQLCNYISSNGELPTKGIVYKDNDNIINTGRADFVQDLDKLPFPSYHKVDFKKYTMSVQRESIDGPRAMPYARIVTSRGCPYSCCFCQAGQISGKKVRMRSVENIMAEIRWLIKEYGIKALLFDDDNLVYDKERATQLFKAMIDENLNIKWNSITIATYRLDEELIALMRQSGCEYVNIAIDSGTERVLKDIIHKPLQLSHAVKVAKLLKKYNIDFAANFIIGFPGETWNEIRETIKFAEDFDADYTKIFIATPLPNTELYKIAKERGYLIDNFSFDRHLWTDGAINTNEFTANDMKFLRAYEWDRINFSTEEKRNKVMKMMNISKERLNEIRKDTLKRASSK